MNREGGGGGGTVMMNSCPIERFRSFDQRPYWFAKAKDDFCITTEFNSKKE